ncbi:MFS transporter [Singulisphaera acidiphila]|uniref:Arabinose efflux permease family protein n=1 Tax=Singulisphaera acidiphila (strain ATCC BAA-1392 / DSM 18658 / VKM B-2454 / MOB10) TaxID=886293 RepID=L0DIS0_SINAD|nr:MFS transporter [Singulisphaera acidiphila]AGA29284.1 arabinose efflux permease family protein [Singulisphaera acidiphila DSM 18658]
MSVVENEATMPGRAMVTLALLLAMAVAALEQTVVSTAMPSIIAQLKGLDIYPWVFSAYLLAATVSTPIYGKLADIFGRKRILLFGLALFALGSMLSGMAQSMPSLIAMRVVQGLGAGALGPIVLTMLGDLFTLQERAKVQGLFSAVWGGSSLIGPALGGILTDRLSWRWVFFVTVPFGLISAWILMRYVHEKVERKSVAPIDWGGATLLAVGSFLLLMGVLGGTEISSRGTVGLLAMAAVTLMLFVRQERVAADPVLPLDLVLSPHIGSAIAGSFLIGALLFGIDTYIPLFMQGVRGGTATSAGKMITPLFLSWSISVAVAAKVVVRLGFRRTAVVGSLFITAGVFSLVVGAAQPSASGPFFLVGMVVIGIGMGPASLSYILSVQNEVNWGRRGVATGAVTFFRTMGGALGVGVLGATLAFMLARRLAASNAVGIDIAAALRPETHKLLTGPQLMAVQAALGRSLRDVFLQMFAMAVLACLCSFGLRGGRAVAQGNSATSALDQKAVELTVGIEH